MKKSILAVVIIGVLSILILLCLGCGAAKTKDGLENGNGTLGSGDHVMEADYQQGLIDGTAAGYQQGYKDGKGGVHAPEPEVDEDNNESYITGYMEGFSKGYENGYSDAQAANVDNADEIAAVESAMLSFVKQNAVPGLEFKIENLVIHGDEAAGIAVCTSEKLDNPLVVMKKGANGWYGVDFGTGIEPPPWYP
jgi:hypothetical protein